MSCTMKKLFTNRMYSVVVCWLLHIFIPFFRRWFRFLWRAGGAGILARTNCAFEMRKWKMNCAFLCVFQFKYDSFARSHTHIQCKATTNAMQCNATAITASFSSRKRALALLENWTCKGLRALLLPARKLYLVVKIEVNVFDRLEWIENKKTKS